GAERDLQRRPGRDPPRLAGRSGRGRAARRPPRHDGAGRAAAGRPLVQGRHDPVVRPGVRAGRDARLHDVRAQTRARDTARARPQPARTRRLTPDPGRVNSPTPAPDPETARWAECRLAVRRSCDGAPDGEDEMPAQRWFRRVARVTRTTIAVAAVAVVAASPVAVLAATPTRVPGEPVVEPTIDPTSPLIGIVTAVGGIVVAIGVLIIMARVLAGIGGTSPRSTSVWRRPWLLAISGVALVIGILGGRAIAYAATQGGLSIIGAGVLAMLIGAVVIALVIIGLIAIRFRHGDISRAIATVIAAAGLLAVGSNRQAATTRGHPATHPESHG